MRMIHRLVGYDRTTERVQSQHDIPAGRLPLIREIAHVPASDPDMIGSYPLEAAQARDVAGILNIKIDVADQTFFIEAYDPMPIAARA
jgi:hypothetical protein